MSHPIPRPPTVPFLGNVTQIESEVPLRSFELLAKQYGEIYQLDMLGYQQVVISSYELLNEVSDEKRFRKNVTAGLYEVRNAAGDGLFTADVPKDKAWYIAHRILMPAFSTMNVRNMFDDMVDVISQLVDKWTRFGPYYKIEPSQDFTSLTLEALCLCAMSYRMNCFYKEGLHPFARAMADFLYECGLRAKRPGIIKPFMRGSNAKYEQDMQVMLSYVDNVLEDRKAHPTDKKDILALMLEGKDKETGQGMSEDNIKKNLLTFLIAGHETTSGMLTFILYFLLKNPEAMRKLREEIETLIGDRPMTVNDVHKLPYLLAVMRETLRLAPPAPIRSVTPLEDTTLGGSKYAVEKDISITCGIYMIHRDPKVWGEDALAFKPERMLGEKFEALPPNAWQPFGFGMRGCIGRPFAWQEVQITIVCLLQRFDFVLHDPSYDLQYKQTLTIKPNNFYVHAIPRKGKPIMLATPSSTLLDTHGGETTQQRVSSSTQDLKPLYALYGSNTGTSEAFAQKIASAASAHGFQATIGTLDSVVDNTPTDGPVIIVTASYEGQPADNAAHFVEWLSSLNGKELNGASFGVFGCGNHDWVNTYQRIPTLCDDLLCERGGKRLVERGEGDAGSAEFFESFDNWEIKLWAALTKEYGTRASSEDGGLQVKSVETGMPRAAVLRQPDATLGTLVENRVLTAPGVPVKRHLEFDLPEGAIYRTGDYLAILPVNPARDVKRAVARFSMLPEQEVTITSHAPSSLPVDRPISVTALLSGYVELSQPATTRDLRELAQYNCSEDTVKKLQALAESYNENVLAKRLSVLDIIEAYPDIDISLSKFLQLLPSMRVRQYSISSSPLSNPQRVSLTVSVLEAPAISGRSKPFLGVASTYLADLMPGDKVQIAVRPSNAAFHPPEDLSVPLLMVCAGSGLAPMHGFLQERALQKLSGREVAKSILFFGCRAPGQDFLYSDSDLKEWTELGIVDVKPAFSRATEESQGCKYVQDRIWRDRAEIVETWNSGAKFFVCGSRKMSSAVKEKLTAVVQEVKNVDADTAAQMFSRMVNGRFATDVFE